MPPFRIASKFTPRGDQPQAIDELVQGLEQGVKAQTLLGVTGSGKTFTVAQVIERVQRPTLIMAPNKTLAAQLFNEYRELFPDNAVEFFVSYYDYYQPEAYVPSTDTFIEKDSAINDAIDRMRHAATHALLTRDDVIIVASVSCIYGLGTAEAYIGMRVEVRTGQRLDRDELLRRLVGIQYSRNQIDFHRGTFRVRGDTVEIFPAYENARAIRVTFFGDEVESIHEVDSLRGALLQKLDKVSVFPATHYVVTPERRQIAIQEIKGELVEQVEAMRREGRLVEAQRLDQRTTFDLEMLVTMGYCSGIENYSRHLTGRAEGEAPPCLINYFPANFLLVIDESHVTVPQIGGMYRGDRSRKQTLVSYGFRLPSALDNRPLRFDEFDALVNQVIYVSATPGDFELEASEGVIVEQIIRPTGLLDPEVLMRPAQGQVDDALAEIRQVIARQGRVLVTTLTKRMAEDLTEYMAETGLRVRYLHSDIDTLERSALLRDLRLGRFDILVGINLLREGLDLPEVALVIVFDADKEGFLRSRRSLIQTIGRASRNVHGRVILYADRESDAIIAATQETQRRRSRQHAHNVAHGVTPQSVVTAIHDLAAHVPPEAGEPASARAENDDALTPAELEGRIAKLRAKMHALAAKLAFEEAAQVRDRIRALEARALGCAE